MIKEVHRMLHFIRLELKKTHFQNYALVFVLAAVLSMLFTAVSLHDTSAKAHTLREAFRVIEMVFAFVFVILFSVLNASVIISEYTNKTIRVMFTYPAGRKQIILAKLLLITALVASFLLAGYAVCCTYLVCMNERFHWTADTFQPALLTYMISRAFATTVVFCALGLWTFTAGMWKKSVPAAITSSVLFIYIRQIAVASTAAYEENIWLILAAVLIALGGVWYTLEHKISDID